MTASPEKGSVHFTMQRVRTRIARQGKACSHGHLKQIDLFRKSLAQSNWTVTKTQTKRPKIRASFGPTISVGYQSLCELMDVDLYKRMDFKEAIKKLQDNLEEGYKVLEVKSIPRLFPSIEESTNLAFYEIKSAFLVDTKPKWESFWSSTSFPVVKKKTDKEIIIDARPLVRSWVLEGDLLKLELRFGPKRTLKPEKIIQAVCDLSDEQIDMSQENPPIQICRTKLCFEKQNKDTIEI